MEKKSVVISGDELWALALAYVSRDPAISLRAALAGAAEDLADLRANPTVEVVKGSKSPFRPLAKPPFRAIAPEYRRDE